MMETKQKNREKIAEKALRKIGIRWGQAVLDFGCGAGHYTISAAVITGEKGAVYALDKNESKLEELKKRVRKRDLENIEIVKSSGDASIELEDNSIDFSLLYDIFWYFNLGDTKLLRLLEEVRRVSVPNSILSIYPKHIDSRKVEEKISKSGFEFKDRYSGTLLHEGRQERGELLNFSVKTD